MLCLELKYAQEEPSIMLVLEVYEYFLSKWWHKFEKIFLFKRGNLTFKSHSCNFPVLSPRKAPHEEMIFLPFFIHFFYFCVFCVSIVLSFALYVFFFWCSFIFIFFKPYIPLCFV
jgi:hypothetical protein